MLFINPAFKRSELLNPERLSLPPPSHSAVRQVHALQVGAEKFRSPRKQSTQVKGRNLFQDESYCPQGLWKCLKKIQNHLRNLTKVLSPQLLHGKLNDQLLKDNKVVNTAVQYQKHRKSQREKAVSLNHGWTWEVQKKEGLTLPFQRQFWISSPQQEACGW